MFGKENESQYEQPTIHVEEITIGASLGAAILTEVGHTKCNAVSDMDVTTSCISEMYYHILSLI